MFACDCDTDATGKNPDPSLRFGTTVRNVDITKGYLFSFASFSSTSTPPGINFLSGALRCSSSSGCGSGLRGSIWSRIAVL